MNDFFDNCDLNCLYSFQGKKKKFFSDILLTIFICKDEVLIFKNNERRQPKYIIRLGLSYQIQWILDNRKDKKPEFKAFSFKNFNQTKRIEAQSKDIQQMKHLIRNKICFQDITELYQPIQLLGQGASSKVYLADNYLCQKQSAIKVIEKDYLAKTQDGINALISEINIMIQLQNASDYFVTLKEVYENKTKYYLVVDMMNGKTLQEELNELEQKKEKMCKTKIKMIMRKLLNGCSIMHEQKIMHRDIKPANLIFENSTDYSSLKICDFGYATSSNLSNCLFHSCGTPGFVAPEIIQYHLYKIKYSQSVNIFSCGCIFLKLLTGQDLFQGNTQEEILIENAKFNIKKKINNIIDIEDDTRDLLQKLLKLSPKERISAKNSLNQQYFQDQAFKCSKQKSIFRNNSIRKSLLGSDSIDCSIQFSLIKQNREIFLLKDDQLNSEYVQKQIQKYQFPEFKKPQGIKNGQDQKGYKKG